MGNCNIGFVIYVYLFTDTPDLSDKHMIVHEYEEYHEWNSLWSWAFIAFLSASLITVCMVSMMMIMDYPREWDHGNLNFTPSASVYSTTRPGKIIDKMIQPLPEGVPMNESINNE
jgi:hypothetical protein